MHHSNKDFYWKCPLCGRRMLDEEYQLLKVDVECSGRYGHKCINNISDYVVVIDKE